MSDQLEDAVLEKCDCCFFPRSRIVESESRESALGYFRICVFCSSPTARYFLADRDLISTKSMDLIRVINFAANLILERVESCGRSNQTLS